MRAVVKWIQMESNACAWVVNVTGRVATLCCTFFFPVGVSLPVTVARAMSLHRSAAASYQFRCSVEMVFFSLHFIFIFSVSFLFPFTVRRMGDFECVTYCLRIFKHVPIICVIIAIIAVVCVVVITSNQPLHTSKTWDYY